MKKSNIKAPIQRRRLLLETEYIPKWWKCSKWVCKYYVINLDFASRLNFPEWNAHKNLNVIIGCSCKKCVKYHRQRYKVNASPLFRNAAQFTFPSMHEPWSTSQWTPTKLQSNKHFIELFTFERDAWLIHPLEKKPTYHSTDAQANVSWKCNAFVRTSCLPCTNCLIHSNEIKFYKYLPTIRRIWVE